MSAAVRIVDTTMRDGSHSVAHQYTPEQVATVAKMLDEAGVWAIAVGHGDGLGAGSRQYGFGAHMPTPSCSRAAAEVVERARDRGRAATRASGPRTTCGPRTTPAPPWSGSRP